MKLRFFTKLSESFPSQCPDVKRCSVRTKTLKVSGLLRFLHLEPIILTYIPFGKNKGKKFLDIAKEARGDLHYMLKSDNLDQDMKASLEHALEVTKEEAILTITFGKKVVGIRFT